MKKVFLLSITLCIFHVSLADVPVKTRHASGFQSRPLHKPESQGQPMIVPVYTPVQQLPVQQYPVQQYPVQQLPIQQYPVHHYQPIQQYPVMQYPVQHYHGVHHRPQYHQPHYYPQQYPQYNQLIPC